jgi:hypothetical protein
LRFSIADLRFYYRTPFANRNSQIANLLILSVQAVAAAAATELVHFQPVRRILLVLGRHVIPLFALGALQNYVISRHKYL